MVQVESEGYNKAKVTVPMCAMQGGLELQKYVDLLIPSPPATFKIINGEGPIHLIGSHCVDYYGFKEEEDDDDDETEDEADEEMETDSAEESDEKKTPSKSKEEKKRQRRLLQNPREITLQLRMVQA